MPTITLKDLPRKLHRELKKRAKVHHRSLNREVIATLHAAASATRAADVETMVYEAREARGRFKRKVRVVETGSWKNKGRL